jgi:SAM-dependent methyltransferase
VNRLNELLDNSGKTNDFLVFSLDNAENNLNACDYLKFHGDATHIPESFYEKFDVVVSANAFEHILTLPQVIEKIYCCLKTGGKLFTSFAPIWSCAVGHHYAGGKYDRVLQKTDFSFNNIEKDGVPPFIHLLKNEEETREYFADKSLPFGQAQIDCLCKWSYHSDEINRLFFEDYEEIMANSKFKKYKMTPIWIQEPSKEIFEELCKKYPEYKRFDVCGIEILAEK